MTEAGVVTSLAISFLLRQRGRAGGDLLGPQPSPGLENLRLLSASDLSNPGLLACSSQSPSAVPRGILLPEERKVCAEVSKLLTAAFFTRVLALEAKRENISLSRRIIAQRRPC